MAKQLQQEHVLKSVKEREDEKDTKNDFFKPNLLHTDISSVRGNKSDVLTRYEYMHGVQGTGIKKNNDKSKTVLFSIAFEL